MTPGEKQDRGAEVKGRMPKMPKLISHRPIKVQVPSDLYWAIFLTAARTGRSMGDVVYDAARSELEKLLRRPRDEVAG